MIDYIIHEEGKLCIGLNVDNNYLEVSIGDDNIEFIDGYAVIEFEITDLCYVSGIINSDYKIATPFNVTKDSMKTITLFKNKKAIYEIVNEEGMQKFSLIDLDNVKSVLAGKGKAPLLNTIMEFDGYDDLNDESAIILVNNQYKILDASNVKTSNISFDSVLEGVDKEGNKENFGVINISYTQRGLNTDIYYMDGEYMPSYNLFFRISPAGKITNPIYVDDIALWLEVEKLDDLDYIIKVVNDNIIEPKKEDGVCKVLQ